MMMLFATFAPRVAAPALCSTISGAVDSAVAFIVTAAPAFMLVMEADAPEMVVAVPTVGFDWYWIVEAVPTFDAIQTERRLRMAIGPPAIVNNVSPLVIAAVADTADPVVMYPDERIIVRTPLEHAAS